MPGWGSRSMAEVRVENHGGLLQTLLIKMILAFQPPHKIFFHFNMLLYFVWVFCFPFTLWSQNFK